MTQGSAGGSSGLVVRLRHRAMSQWRTRSTARLRDPSFTYKVLEMRRERRMLRELGRRDPAYAVNAKDDAHAWARRLGVRVPELYGVFADVADVPWSALPDGVVLKPCRGTTSTGVRLLRATGDGWTDLGSGRAVSASALVRDHHALVERGTVSAEVLVEQLVRDPRCPDLAPVDYKVSVLYGEVGLVEAKAHRRADGRSVHTWRVFDPGWRDLGNVFNDLVMDDTIPPPVHADALLEMARRVSLAVPRAYLRVDLYDDLDGPVFGEITPEPGGVVEVRPDVDRRLGELWEAAEVRLQARAADLGVTYPDAVDVRTR